MHPGRHRIQILEADGGGNPPGSDVAVRFGLDLPIRLPDNPAQGISAASRGRQKALGQSLDPAAVSALQ